MGWWVGSGHSRSHDSSGQGLSERKLIDAHHDRLTPEPPMLPATDRSAMTETPLNRLALIAILAGAVTGLLVAGLNYAIVLTEQLVYGTDHLTTLDPGSAVSPTRLAITLVFVGVLNSWAWYLLGKFGRPMVSVPGAMRGRPMPTLETLLSVFIQVTSVAAGAPVGRENAPRLAGGLSAASIASWFHLDLHSRRIVVASAAGAGLAASFHLPLAGALFTLELLLVEMSTRTVVTAMLTSATAVATTGLFITPHPIYRTIPLTEDFHNVIAAIIVGFLAGMAGHWFGIAARAAAAARPLDWRILWQMPLAFAAVALSAYFIPGVSANGRWAAHTIFTIGLPLGTLIILGIARVMMVLVCFRVGTVGGTLTPAFSLGAIIGAMIGLALDPLFPQVPLGACALMGAAAFLSTTMAAPMFGMIAAIEFTDMQAQGYLPMFVAVVSAAIAVRIWGLITNKEQRVQPFTSAAWTGETASTRPTGG